MKSKGNNDLISVENAQEIIFLNLKNFNLPKKIN